MPIDNKFYDRDADIWWNEQEPLSLLRTLANPPRLGYFRAVLSERLGRDPRGMSALDVGCGGGLLAEEFARLGCAVTGIDPSAPSLATARAHAARSGLHIEYRAGVGEALPCDAASFDIVYCCDVLEHVNDVDGVIAEIARVLKPGGVFLYDTINRTFLSRLVMLGLAQQWSYTSFVPPNLHDWNRFVTPRELHVAMARHGLESREMTGVVISGNPLTLLGLLSAIRARKRGRISYGELGRRIAAASRLGDSLATSYAGYALKV